MIHLIQKCSHIVFFFFIKCVCHSNGCPVHVGFHILWRILRRKYLKGRETYFGPWFQRFSWLWAWSYYFGPEANPGIWVEEAGGSRAAYHKLPWQQRGQRGGTRCFCRMCPLAYFLQLDLISNLSVLWIHHSLICCRSEPSESCHLLKTVTPGGTKSLIPYFGEGTNILYPSSDIHLFLISKDSLPF